MWLTHVNIFDSIQIWWDILERGTKNIPTLYKSEECKERIEEMELRGLQTY